MADTTPCAKVETQALFISHQLYELAKDSLVDNFDSLYKAKCLGAKYTEQFYAEYQPKEYHYTLYYYDQAGNLVKTLPPAAVKPNFSASFLSAVATARDAGNDYENNLNNQYLATNYRYNTLNQVAEQKTPDAGISRFWYDRLGRLAVSQNAQQILSNRYSYTLYDPLGRITQVGQNVETSAMTQVISQDTTALQNWLNGSAAKEQITGTVYDEAYTPLQTSIDGFSGLYQRNLRNRVSYTYVEDMQGANWDAAIFYSYDIHSNVDTLLQDYQTGMGAINCLNDPNNHSGNRFKKIVYNYDLISGKVNEVAYQKGYPDQFYHKYTYDAENRITEVQTSKDSIYWERDALYDYYRHGPLARVLLGQNSVQGIDYAYTIQGWLKGVNSLTALPNSNGCAVGTVFNDLTISDRSQEGSPSVYTARNSITFEPGFESTTNDSFATSIDTSAGTCDVIGQTLAATDMGNDGSTGSNVAQDAYGFTLHYFDNGSTHDYIPIGAGETLQSTSPTGFSFASLYNGNIGAMSVNVPAIGDPLLYTYRYDQLNRINSMQAYKGLNPQTNSWEPNSIDDYKENVSYDPNGNILSYNRHGDAARISMDSLLYSYKPNRNELDKVVDNAPDDLVDYSKYNDIKQHQTNGNYKYDSIGNLIMDSSENITNIVWNVYGKIKSITKGSSTISYTYDASGNRISKAANGVTTYYVRDASSNIMSIYEMQDTLKQKEIDLYGSSRLGVYNVNVDVQSCGLVPSEYVTFERGDKFFELDNHLDNVLATVNDKHIQHTSGGDTVDYYNPEVVTAQDYYPGGMQMPGRKYQSGSSSYRYGFNGKELDKETASTTTYDYGFRIYSPGLGRFLSVDPLTKSYPWLTPYQFSGNNPIRFIDLDGLEVANPSIFRTAWNAITGDFHLNRMNSYLTENKLSSDNVIELNNETSVVYQVQKNAATGTNQTIYSVFRKARQGRDCLFCVQSSKDDDIGLTENEFLNTTVLSAHIMDAPIGLGGASKIGAVINGSKNAYYSFRQTVGVVRQGLRALGNWKNEIKFGTLDALGTSGDLLTKGFHLHFNNLKGLELGLTTTEGGELGLKFLKGDGSLAKEGVKLFSQAIENNGFRSALLGKLKMGEEALTDATKVLQSGSRDLKNAENSLNEIRNVITTISKNYAPK